MSFKRVPNPPCTWKHAMRSRRDALQAGAIGILGLGLNHLAGLRQASASESRSPSGKAKSCIFIFLSGGLSQHDSFDMKPLAPDNIRGEFQPRATKTPGLQICEHLPKLAAVTDRFMIIRGVTHTLGAHLLGQKFINSGNRPTPALEYPAFGSVAAKELMTESDLPGYVAIPRASQGAGHLGVKFSALATNEVPQSGRPFNVRGITLAGGITLSEIDRRKGLLEDLDQRFSSI